MCLIFTKVHEIDVHFGPYRYVFGGSQIHKIVFVCACVHVSVRALKESNNSMSLENKNKCEQSIYNFC